MALKINDKDPVKQAMADAKLKAAIIDNCPVELDGYATIIRYAQVILELQAKLEISEAKSLLLETEKIINK